MSEPAEEGRANRAALRLLAETLDIPLTRVTLVSGHSSRDKIVELEGLEQAQTERLLASSARRKA